MSLRSLEEQSSELHRREDIEDREQAERESGERVLHEWKEEGTTHRLVEEFNELRCHALGPTGELARIYYATPLMREILRLSDQVQAARVAPLHRLRSLLIDHYNGCPPLSVGEILDQVQREVEEDE